MVCIAGSPNIEISRLASDFEKKKDVREGQKANMSRGDVIFEQWLVTGVDVRKPGRPNAVTAMVRALTGITVIGETRGIKSKLAKAKPAFVPSELPIFDVFSEWVLRSIQTMSARVSSVGTGLCGMLPAYEKKDLTFLWL